MSDQLKPKLTDYLPRGAFRYISRHRDKRGNMMVEPKDQAEFENVINNLQYYHTMTEKVTLAGGKTIVRVLAAWKGIELLLKLTK